MRGKCQRQGRTVMWEVNVSLVRRIWNDSSLMTSVDIGGFKEHQNDSCWGILPRSLLKYIACRPKEKPPKTATYQQWERERERALNDSYTLLRELETLAISVPASLCICCTTEQRDLVGLSSLIFLLVFLHVFSLSLSPSLSDLSHHMETKVMADWNIIEV